MGTRSRLGIKTNEGIVTIHVHYSDPADEQVDFLNTHYNTLDAVTKLVNNGDLSILGETVAECEPVGHGRYTLEERKAKSFKDAAECLANTDAGWVVLYDPETHTWDKAGHAKFFHTEDDYEAIANLVAEEISSNTFWIKHPELSTRLFEEATRAYFENRDYGSSVDTARYEASHEVSRIAYLLEREEE